MRLRLAQVAGSVMRLRLAQVGLTIFLERSPNLVVQPISVVSQWYLFECLFGPFLWSAGRRDIFVVGYLTYMLKIYYNVENVQVSKRVTTIIL